MAKAAENKKARAKNAENKSRGSFETATKPNDRLEALKTERLANYASMRTIKMEPGLEHAEAKRQKSKAKTEQELSPAREVAAPKIKTSPKVLRRRRVTFSEDTKMPSSSSADDQNVALPTANEAEQPEDAQKDAFKNAVQQGAVKLSEMTPAQKASAWSRLKNEGKEITGFDEGFAKMKKTEKGDLLKAFLVDNSFTSMTFLKVFKKMAEQSNTKTGKWVSSGWLKREIGDDFSIAVQEKWYRNRQRKLAGGVKSKAKEYFYTEQIYAYKASRATEQQIEGENAEIELEDDDQMEGLGEMRGVLEWNRDRTSVGFEDGPAMLADLAGAPAMLMDARREDLHRAM
jgi:hypothetical protein